MSFAFNLFKIRKIRDILRKLNFEINFFREMLKGVKALTTVRTG